MSSRSALYIFSEIIILADEHIGIAEVNVKLNPALLNPPDNLPDM